jgi:NAD(P)-dependent dehydrogenase (short-subunit alcohol dehydrogenase family)
MTRLKGRKIVITGGASGIGYATRSCSSAKERA